MAIIYSDAAGYLLRFLISDEEVRRYGPPESFAYSLEFDLDTNMTLVATLQNSTDNMRLIESVLTINGQPVTINPPSEQHQAEAEATTGYTVLPDWARTGTAAQAETYITAQILNGYTIAQAEAYVDATIKNITTANVSQINAQLANVRSVFKMVADALIVMRGLFVITAKLLIYIRDLVIRFRRE